jgi:hypothetical protein
MALFRQVQLLIGSKEQGQINHYGMIMSDEIEKALTEMAEKHDLVYITIYERREPYTEVRSPQIDSQVTYTRKEEQGD